MHCPITRKRSFQDESTALEALVNNHSRNFHDVEAGPRNIYACQHCGNWHFTSKGEVHPFLTDEENKSQMKADRLAWHWERKLR